VSVGKPFARKGKAMRGVALWLLLSVLLLQQVCSLVVPSRTRRGSSLWGSRGGGSSGGARREGGGGGGGSDALRQLRVARGLRDELTSIICDIDIKASVYPNEELLRSTSISEVEVSADLSFAKVFVSVLGNSVEKRQIFVWLCENVGQIRYSLAKRLRHMRRVPEITFKLSDNQDKSDLIALIDQLTPKTKAPTESFEDFDITEEDEEGQEEDE
jgi:ribosome-binding factor A